MKEVNTQKFRTFELGNQEGINIPIWTFVGFEQTNRQDSQILNNDNFHISTVTSAQCVIGTEKYPDLGIFLNCDDDVYSQYSGQLKEAFRALTKDDTLKQYISDVEFTSFKEGKDIGYKL